MSFLLSLGTILMFSFSALAQAPTTQGGGVPEIPVGAAPLVVAGIVGAVMLIRSRRNKAK